MHQKSAIDRVQPNWSVLFTRRGGNRPLHATSPLTMVFRQGQHTSQIVGTARLDNRQELHARLQCSRTTSDLQLILAAYKRWGVASLSYLLGIFSFALWDAERQQLFCARDQMGIMSFFYYQDPNYFVCSAEIKHLLGQPNVPHRPNLHQITAKRFGGLPLDSRETFFEQIYELPGGFWLLATDNDIQIKRYWQPDPYRRLDIPTREVPSALRHLLYEAVRARLPNDQPVGAELSGGLDSSAVVAVAADVLRQQNRSLLTFSTISAPDAAEDYLDERRYAAQFESFDNVEQHYVAAPGHGPFDNLEQLIANADTPNVTTRHFLYTALTQAANERGVSALFTGIGGEYGVSNHCKQYFTEQFYRLRWLTLARELQTLANNTERSLSSVTKSRLIKPLAPPRLLKLLGYSPSNHFSLAQLQTNHIFQDNLIAEHERQFRKSRLEEQLLFAQQAEKRHRPSLAANIDIAARFGGGTIFRYFGYEKANHLHPLFDRRVIEFCLAADVEWKVRDGYKRYLVRAALDGLLPSAIQWRTTKDPFSPDYPRRYNRQLPWVRTFLASIRPNDPIRAVIDIDKLKRLTQHEMVNNWGLNSADFASLIWVPFGIYTITFLRQFSDYR